MEKNERLELARSRLVNVLRKQKVANFRTLEQKIADAGPFNQRVNPHILTTARNHLLENGTLVRIIRQVPWFHLSDTPSETVNEKLQQLEPIHSALQSQRFNMRLGQTLEIAIFRALKGQSRLNFLGHFNDLDEHDDSSLYSKEEPPSGLSGNLIPNGKKLDFVVVTGEAGFVGIEAKNVREWLYPNRDEVRDLLLKCCYANAVPVLIGRRIPFVTFKLLNACGAIVHQTYNQLYPSADSQLAGQAANKDLLGYHDIRVGNQPDGRLVKFFHTNLPNVVDEARLKFDAFKDLVEPFARNSISYAEFAGRVRRRLQGTTEDHDWEDS